MKKSLFFFFCVSFLFFGTSYAQSAKDALLGLKKMQARVQSGISYKEYGAALGEARFPVNLYMESSESDDNEELKDAIKKAIEHYQFAGEVWQDSFRNRIGTISKTMEPIVIVFYPVADKNIREGGARGGSGDSTFLMKEGVLPIVWREASTEIKIASDLLAQEDAKSQSKSLQKRKQNKKK
ncbi:MAG: hypothetical protein ACYDHW_10920 [Syntrophorhabdaceae bacterium]